MKKHNFSIIFLLFLFIQLKNATEVSQIDELKTDLDWIIVRETNNLELLHKNYEKFNTYFTTNIKDVRFDGELVRNREIIDDELVNIKLKLHQVADIPQSLECYSKSYNDLYQMYGKLKDDIETCHASAFAAYGRYLRDFFNFKKAAKRIIGRVKKILQVCKFGKIESYLCKRQHVPIKELGVIGNHTYQYEVKNVHITDEILQDARDCNAQAIKPVSELALRFVDSLDEECDFQTQFI